ncbi:MAG TPA: glycosyltransferase [Chryseolinea sp.]
MSALVSIILTVYKRTEYIRQAIDSALAQTFRNFEILVTDDSDSEEIRRICDDYSHTGLLRYRSNRPRLGVVGNLKAAINETNGKFISILNDDDYWSPVFLEQLVAALEANPDCALAFCDFWIVDSKGQIDAGSTKNVSALYVRDKLDSGIHHDAPQLAALTNSITLAMGSVFRRSELKVDDIPDEAAGSYDLCISCLLAATGRSFYYIQERLTYYRVHSAMETARQVADSGRSIAFVYNEIHQRNFFPGLRAAIEAKLAEALFVSGLMELRYGDGKHARSSFLKALKLRMELKSFAGIVVSLLPPPLAKKLSQLSFEKN